MPVKIQFPDQADYRCPRSLIVEQREEPPSIIDLRVTTFTKPFGIALLYGLICDLRRQRDTVHVLLRDRDVGRYLWRMDLHRPFASDEGVIFDPDIKGYRFGRWLQPKQLLELTIVEVANDDEVVAAEQRIWEIIAARAPRFLPLADQIRTAVVELISNVERHSETGRAMVLAQTHEDCVRLVVGDTGIGVRRSLERVHDLTGWRDPDVLRFATGLGVTGSPGGGGMGLWTITDAIRQNGLSLHMASGGGLYSVYRTTDEATHTALKVPGMIIEVAFSRPGS